MIRRLPTGLRVAAGGTGLGPIVWRGSVGGCASLLRPRFCVEMEASPSVALPVLSYAATLLGQRGGGCVPCNDLTAGLPPPVTGMRQTVRVESGACPSACGGKRKVYSLYRTSVRGSASLAGVPFPRACWCGAIHVLSIFCPETFAMLVTRRRKACASPGPRVLHPCEGGRVCRIASGGRNPDQHAGTPTPHHRLSNGACARAARSLTMKTAPLRAKQGVS